MKEIIKNKRKIKINLVELKIFVNFALEIATQMQNETKLIISVSYKKN